MSEPITLSERLHADFIAAVHGIRADLGMLDAGWFEFSIKCEGRTESGADNVKIEYMIGTGYECRVKGNELEAVLSELMRRHGWNERHAPLALAAPDAHIDDEYAA